MNIGLFGGSFNPIHNGHVSLAKALLREAALDEVWFMVSPQNPLKTDQRLLDDGKRLQLVRAALEGEPHLVACDFEFGLPKPSYTWNTLEALKQQFPDHRFTLLIGGDNWADFRKWYRYKDILRNYAIVVYPRSGADTVIGDDIPETTDIRIVNTPLLDISSTMIRERLKRGESISGLVPKAAAAIIGREGLYR